MQKNKNKDIPIDHLVFKVKVITPNLAKFVGFKTEYLNKLNLERIG
jgi:hypothetical protein